MLKPEADFFVQLVKFVSKNLDLPLFPRVASRQFTIAVGFNPRVPSQANSSCSDRSSMSEAELMQKSERSLRDENSQLLNRGLKPTATNKQSLRDASKISEKHKIDAVLPE